MLEHELIQFCAPTLAGLKTGNLIALPWGEGGEKTWDLEQWNRRLGSKGVTLTVLCRKGRTALLYVYREARLQRDLQAAGVQTLLQHYGYQSMEASDAIETLKRRLEDSAAFPHEIGVFLSYPLEDVVGYIRNRGKHSKATGYWQVYGDEERAQRLFSEYRRCKARFQQLFEEGMTVMRLTAAV